MEMNETKNTHVLDSLSLPKSELLERRETKSFWEKSTWRFFMSEQEYEIGSEFYDLFYGDLVEDIELFKEYARKQGSPILELMSGTGRVLLPLAKEGFEVWGLDINPKMIAIAKEKIRKEPIDTRKRIVVVRGDIRDFKLPRKFKLITIAANSFLHMLTIEDQEKALACVREHLSEDGILIISIFNPKLDRPQNVLRYDNTKEIPKEGKKVMRFHIQSFDFPNQITKVQYIFDIIDRKGNLKRKIFPFKLRYMFYDEMVHLLRRCGFEIVDVFGDYDKRPFNELSERMVFIAKPR